MTETTTKKRTRRTPEQRIADLEAEIDRVKQRAAVKEARQDPAVAEATRVARVINRSISDAEDPALKDALVEARDALGAYLDGRGVALPKTRQRRTQAASSAA